MKRAFIALTAASLLIGFGTSAGAADTTQRVSGDTVDVAAGENGSSGWWINRDSAAAHAFAWGPASTGNGSLFVAPIIVGAGQKLVAENFVFAPIEDDTTISFDFLRGPIGSTSNYYLNVYANVVNDNKFYDCRFDYVATGSPTGWTTLSTAAGATHVQKSTTARLTACPASLGEMPEGSAIRMFSLNVGQSSDSDLGVSGHLDNVVMTSGGAATAWDFEGTKDGCKAGGWTASSAFKNQGACVAYASAYQD